MHMAARILLALWLAVAVSLAACTDSPPTPTSTPPAAPGGVAPQTCEQAAINDVDAKRTRFAMSLFHYNIEYVIGGLDYTDRSGKRHLFIDPKTAAGWTNSKVEDWIVTETFAPILAMYDKHPSWGVDIELQGYMIEVLAARHPQTLALLRKLAVRGQVELISFHYAAQLFLAFPFADHARSVTATKAIFAKYCLPLSRVVFNQEGQAGEGRQRALVQHGYEIGVHPKNLWGYVRHGEVPWPWYSSEGGTVIVGPGGVEPDSGIEVAWDFFDDGELRSVPGKLNPYFAPLAAHSAERVAEFEAKLQARQDDGWHLTTVGDYVRHLEAAKVDKKAAPPLLDGTWQPQSTDSIHRWLGGRSDTFSSAEEDDKVRTGNAVARMHVNASQILLEHLKAADLEEPADALQMDMQWRLLWHAQVSDCSGVNPWRGEVMFGLDANTMLLETAKKQRSDWLERLGWSHVEVDLKTRTAKALKSLPGDELLPPAAPPLPVTITAAERTVTVAWSQPGAQRWQLDVAFGPPADEPCGTCDVRHLAVSFPRKSPKLAYCPGLIEDEVRTYALDDFSWDKGEAWLPLANGLVGLGKDWWAIKHVRQVHVAARIRPDVAQIDFVDESLQPASTPSWRFTVFKGSASDALQLANRINIHPVVRY